MTHEGNGSSSAAHRLAELLAPGGQLSSLARAFAAAGHQLYLVGGTVRDAYLDRSHGDIDLATDAQPDETKQIVAPGAGALWLQGVAFGTVGAELDGLRVEITTFRTERYEPDSRHPEVSFAADIHSDLSRRDFTINAIALKLPGGELVDPFGGREDLRARLITTPGVPEDSFDDDPLRMLRAFRFASQLEFRIDARVLTAVEKMKDKLRTISAERIRDELARLVVGAAPRRALELAERTGLTDLFLPELSELRLEQDPVHRHKDVFHHTLAVVERTEPTLELRLAALLHDIGKPKTRRIGPEGVSFHHHEVVGAEMAARRLRDLRFSKDVVTKVSEMIRLHHRFHTYRLGWTDAAVRRYVRDAGPLLGSLNALVRADCTTRNASKARELATRMDELEQRISELAKQEELSRIRPDLDGQDVMELLGVPPGPVVGEALRFLLDERMEEGPLGREEAVRRLRRWAEDRGLARGEG